MDGNVSKRLLKREKLLWEEGFDRIIGLRDMYSKQYREAVTSAIVDANEIERFKKSYRQQIGEQASLPYKIHLHFAIMETEAWVLGLSQAFVHLDQRLTPSYVQSKLGMDFESDDPEMLFHPANELKKVYELVEQRYDKSKGDVNALMSRLTKQDFKALYDSPRCNSFNEFCDSLLGKGLLV